MMICGMQRGVRLFACGNSFPRSFSPDPSCAVVATQRAFVWAVSHRGVPTLQIEFPGGVKRGRGCLECNHPLVSHRIFSSVSRGERGQVLRQSRVSKKELTTARPRVPRTQPFPTDPV